MAQQMAQAAVTSPDEHDRQGCRCRIHARRMKARRGQTQRGKTLPELLADEIDAMDEKSIISIDPKPTERLQRLNTFLQVCVPSSTATMHIPPRAVLWELPTMERNSTLLNTAIDAVSLAHLGALHKDPRLARASQEAYSLVLQRLIWVCGNLQQDKISHLEVLMTIFMVGFWAETNRQSHKLDFQTSQPHMLGALNYLEMNKPSILDRTSKLGHLLLREFWSTDVWGGLAYRKRFLVSDAWNKGRPEYHSLLCRANALLERTDKALSRPGKGSNFQSQQELLLLLQELKDAQCRLIELCDAKLEKGGTSVEAHDTDAFDPNIEEHCFMSESALFPTFVMFKNKQDAGPASAHALAGLIVHCALLRVSYNLPATHALTNSTKGVGRRLVTHLCRNTYTLSMLPSLAAAEFLKVQLAGAAAFAEESGAWEEMGWCQACLLATDMRIERLRRTQPPTLCRVGDLGHLLVESCRYQAWRPKPTRLTIKTCRPGRGRYLGG